jgi:hypothetical protein
MTRNPVCGGTPLLLKITEKAAEEGGVAMGEMAVRLICRALGVDEEAGLVPRKPPGRKPVTNGGKRAPGRKRGA